MQTLWQLQAPGPAPPLDVLCDNSIRFPLTCLRDSADTWQEVIALNRPVLLDLVTADRFAAAAVFLGESSGNALLWSDKGLMRVPFVQLAERWRGSGPAAES